MENKNTLEDLMKEVRGKIKKLQVAAGQSDDELIEDEYTHFDSKYDEFKYDVTILKENNALTPDKESEYIKKFSQLNKEIDKSMKELGIN